jgi:hypothetical protein
VCVVLVDQVEEALDYIGKRAEAAS